jgi:hypothetical protein
MGDAFWELCNARLARNAYAGMRRAHRRAVTLLAEYLGVGERVQTTYNNATRTFHVCDVRLLARPGVYEYDTSFHRVMSEDRCMP